MANLDIYRNGQIVETVSIDEQNQACKKAYDGRQDYGQLCE